MSPDQKVYFPALDSLRAIAVTLVFLAHVGPTMSFAGFDPGLKDHGEWGRSGLSLFFVLSGFLITYLLLLEKQASHQIGVRNFYIRRILRIWPAYFLLVVIGQFWLPATGWLEPHGVGSAILANHRMTFYYLLFLPNLAFLLCTPGNPYLGHTWSIGVEEQFYLFWPWILKYLDRLLPAVLWGLIGLTLLSAWSYEHWFLRSGEKTAALRVLSKINAVVYWSNIGYFALGGLMAYYRVQRPRLVKALSGKLIQAISLLGACTLIIAQPHGLNGFVLAVFFALLILHCTRPGTWIARLRHPWLLYLGRISYGMYLFHLIMTMKAARLLSASHAGQMPGLRAAAIILAYLLTVGAAALSYRWVESFFLRLKKKFTAAPTPNAAPAAPPPNTVPAAPRQTPPPPPPI